jgi:uncharacterized membrane protein
MGITPNDIARYIGMAIECVAIAVIVIGLVQAIIDLARVGMRSPERRVVWLGFARWLIAGMTIQLAADLVSTSFDPTWDEIGHLAAIAIIRTFLSFFLDREVESRMKQMERASTTEA